MAIFRDPRVIGTAVVVAIFIWGALGGSFEGLSPKNRLIYVCNDTTAQADYLCAINLDGTGSAMLNFKTEPALEDLKNISAPDINIEGQIVYQCDQEICTHNLRERFEYNVITRDLRTAEPEICCSFFFAPVINDNDEIAFICRSDESYEICVMNSDGQEVRILTRNQTLDDMPSINNGGQIAFVCYASNDQNPRQGGFNEGARICGIKSDGTEFRWLTTEGFGNWSPAINDRGEIAFVCHDGSDAEICIVNFNGTGFRRITDNEFEEGPPAINQNGEIAFSCGDGNDFEICMARSDTSDLEILTDNNLNDLTPDINSEGVVVFICYAERPLSTEPVRSVCSIDSDGANFRVLAGGVPFALSQVSIQ